MKYPQLVSMPSAVQDWLDQQLEARGIDAVVYTRYVFSLLQRDSLDLPDDLLVLNKTKEGGRRRQSGRKRSHREECLSVWDCEKLKRSAAVQCLLSASDQKCGIEKLVDELCTKLKESESESESSIYLALAESSKQAKQIHVPTHTSLDEAQKYYAAFPPLNSKFVESAANSISVPPQANSVWSSGTKGSPTLLGKKRGSISSTSFAEKAVGRKGWKENKENVQGNSWKEVGRENSKTRDHLREKFLSHKSEMGCRLAWDMADNVDDGTLEVGSLGVAKMRCESGVFSCNNENGRAVSPRRLYQRQADSPQNDYEVQAQYRSENRSVSKRVLEDKNLAQLIAKFDHSIEALWTPNEAERPLSPCLLSAELESNGELPVQTSPCGYVSNPFIPSGTNITTSIWSGNEDSLVGNGNLSSEQIVQHCLPNNYQTLEFKSGDNVNTAVWNKTATLPSSVLTSLPFGLNYDFADFTPNINQKWSDVESLTSMENYSQFGKIFSNNYNDFQESLNCSITSVGLHGSLTALNHSKQDSSFTEVIPKNTLDNNYTDLDSRMESMNANLTEEEHALNWEVEEEDLLTSARTHFRPIKQESLDSRRSNVTGYADGTTFLIPDGLETLPFQRSESGALYLESDGPAKYMEYKEKELYGGRSRTEEEPCALAAEFVPKFKIQQNEKCCQTEETKVITTSDEEVDTKRSRQDTSTSCDEDNFFFPGDEQLADKVANGVIDDEETFNNTGCANCRLAEVNYLAPLFQTDFACLEHGGNARGTLGNLSRNDQEMSQAWNEELKICCDCNNLKMWKINNSTLLSGQPGKMANWEPDKSPKSWSDIWSSSVDQTNTPCQKCDLSPSLCQGTSRNGRNLQSLREELSQDGEQLLSDLSYMQHIFLGSDWSDDSREPPVSGCLEERGEEDGNRPSAQKFQCISPGTVDDQEMEMYADDTVYSRSLPGKQFAKEELIEHFETKSVGDFFSTCLRSAPVTTVLSSSKLEAGWKLNERPFNAKSTPKDRKRRHSASQRASSLAPRDLACVIPRAQTACVKGIACPTFVVNVVEALRPVTL